MLLFHCPQCGHILRAQDVEAGQALSCSACGTEAPVPQASDPDCRLVYCDTATEPTYALTADELAAKLASGELGPYDLIWDEGYWKELGTIYELPTPPPPSGTGSSPEIAVRLRELKPISGFEPMPKQPWYARFQSTRSRVNALRGLTVPLYQRILRAVGVLAAVLAVVAGLLWFLLSGSALPKPPTTIVVYNGSSSTLSVQASFGDGEVRTIPPGAVATFAEVRLKTTEGHTLKYWSGGDKKAPEDAAAVKARLAFGQTILINPGRAGDFCSIPAELQQSLQESVWTEKAQESLLAELTRHARPETARKMLETAMASLKNGLRKEESECLSGATFSFAALSIPGMKKPAPAEGEDSRALLLLPGPVAFGKAEKGAQLSLDTRGGTGKLIVPLGQRKFLIKKHEFEGVFTLTVERTRESCTVLLKAEQARTAQAVFSKDVTIDYRAKYDVAAEKWLESGWVVTWKKGAEKRILGAEDYDWRKQ